MCLPLDDRTSILNVLDTLVISSDLTVVKIHGWIRRLSGTIAVKTFELTCPRDVVSSRRIPSGPSYERECFLFFRFPLKTLIIRDPQTFDHAMPAVRSKDKQASEQRP